MRFLSAAAAAAALVFALGSAQAGDAAAGKAKADACADCHAPEDFAGSDVAELTQSIKDVASGTVKHKAKVALSDDDAADIATYWAAGEE